MLDRKSYSNNYGVIRNEKSLSLIEKLKLCLMILISKNFKPTIKFSNGVELDIKNNKIILTKPLHIHCMEDIKLTSDKNVIIESGKKNDPNRPGYNYSIWLNCPKDSNGNPLKLGDS